MLTIQGRVDKCGRAEGALSHVVEGLHLHPVLAVGRDGRVLVGVAVNLGIGQGHLAPLGAVVRLEDDDVAEASSVVVLAVHRLGEANSSRGRRVRYRVEVEVHQPELHQPSKLYEDEACYTQ